MAVHLVLVHGSRLASSQWAPQLPLLEGHVTVGLVDLPGHGTRAAEEFSLVRCVEVIDEAVDAAPPGSRVVLVGHSLGGYAAMAYAAGLGSRLDGLVLAGCSAVPVGPGAAIYRGVAALTDRLGAERMTRINDRVLRRLYAADLIEPVIAGGYFFAPTATAWREVMRDCRPAMLSDMACPVLVLNGQYDQMRLGTKRFLWGLPSVRVEVVPRASHLANLDQPRAFADALLHFADSVDER
ncbi:alpha/beta hydrolase [Intrasporangium calvum]|uniref:Alpha/beta hydrolase n=1 Tax=Intrasporangium calvum TaxID=53358 RepID=A0ABT5GI47_9MICO|nr:alpha/beta hydrolase [Intrasporangium calvum]MDC5697894.1 alpha/beta hydrolase [Intrasporangium calvum]